MHRPDIKKKPVSSEQKVTAHPGFGEVFLFWVKLGWISFGGPTGQIAMMHTELVEKKRWISETRFLHALNYCMLLPGPEAQQLAIYVGWLLHRTWGGIVAGALFVIPSIFVLWILSYIYAAYGHVDSIAAIFAGLKPVVTAIVAIAVIRIGRRALKNEVMWILAALAFVAIYFLKMPFPLIILSAGILGFIGGKLWRKQFLVVGDYDSKGSVLGDEDVSPDHAKPSLSRALKVCALCIALWWAPVLSIGFWQGTNSPQFLEGLFFSKAAMVTFGGAYAVLPYVAQRAVEEYSWLQPGQMLDGLGLAETTPGPLIMVVQFVGFMGGWNQPGELPRLLAATVGALITTWVTFVPCFLWIFLGAPHIEQLRGSATLTTTLSAVTAAVVGVVLNLAVWFAMHVLFSHAGVIDWFALVVSIVAFIGMLKWNWAIIPVVLGGSLAGFIYTLVLHWK